MMPLFLAISKNRQNYLKIVYSLAEDFSPDLEEDPELLKENATLIGPIPAKKLRAYSSESVFCLDEERSKTLQDTVIHYAWERLLRYLSLRERSIGECRSYLQRLQLSEESINDLINKAIKKRYIDEERFAELLTRSYVNRRKSRTELRNALIAKRIPADIIEKIIDLYYTREDRDEILRYHISKGIRKYPVKKSRKDYEKCISYLMRKGFNYADIRDELLLYYVDTGE